MQIREGIRQTLEIISANKVRSFLTMLGINFGVTGLIAIAIIGLSVRESVNRELQQFGSTLLWVRPNYQAYAPGEERTLLSERDIAYFNDSLPGVSHSTTIFSVYSKVAYMGQSKDTSITGTSSDHFQIFSLSVTAGRLITPDEFMHQEKVCILGAAAAASLFKDASPLDKKIRLFGSSFRVVGVKKDTEPGILNDGSNDNTVYVPLDYVSRRIWGGSVVKYWVYFFKFDTIPAMEQVAGRMENYLDNRYEKIRDTPRFIVQKMDSYIGTVNRVMNIISTLVLIIAGISLLVGGLGIMNIMLVTVTERTREIGVRMAVGAGSREILEQFLIEAVTLCLIGGGIGVLFGTVTAVVICRVVLKIPFIFSLLATLAALGLASAIGLVFGIYPAYRASQLTPIEALRVENT